MVHPVKDGLASLGVKLQLPLSRPTKKIVSGVIGCLGDNGAME